MSASTEPELMDVPNLSVIRQVEAAALDVQVSTAKTYPRSIQQFQSDLEAWCTLNSETALECHFAVPKGGKTIIGPSIRFAELVQVAYKNIITDAKVVGEEDGHVIVDCVCRDLERNVASRSQVRRPIMQKNGKRYAQHMVEQTINAAMAIARRNSLFQIIPKALWEPIWQKSKVVAQGDANTFEQRRREMIEEVKALGADMDNVRHFLNGKQPKDIDADDLLMLNTRLWAVKRNEMTLDEAFPKPVGPDPVAAKESKTAAGEALKKLSKNPEVDKETGEVVPSEEEVAAQREGDK